MTLTHAQYYKFLNIQKLNYMNICTGGKIFKSNHDVRMIDGGREQGFFYVGATCEATVPV